MKRLQCIPAARVLCLALGYLCLLALLVHVQARPDAVEAGAPRSVRLPVLMYHSILKDPARQGTYIVSPDVLREDLDYLTAHGYESVLVSDLIAFVTDGAPLPDKPVLITFDDGHYNNLTYVLPLLEETGHRAVVSVVGAYCDRYTEAPDPNPNYAYLSWEEVGVLAESGRIEIGCHSYDMHALDLRPGAGRIPGESSDAYRAAFTDDAARIQSLIRTHTGMEPLCYAYPFGIIAEESREALLSLGIRCSLSCNERVSIVTQGEPESLLALGRFNRPAGIRTADFMARLLGGDE